MLAAALVVASIAASARPAHALVPTIPQNADDIAEWVRMGAPEAPLPPCASALCQGLTAGEQSMPNSAAGNRILQQTKILRTRVGLLRPISGLGTVGLGVTAFTTGWSIGTGIRSLFIKEEIPPEPFAIPHPVLPYIAAGETLFASGTSRIVAPTDGLRQDSSVHDFYYILGNPRCDHPTITGDSSYEGPISPLMLIPGSVTLNTAVDCIERRYDRTGRVIIDLIVHPGDAQIYVSYYPLRFTRPAIGAKPGDWPSGPGFSAPRFDPDAIARRVVDEIGGNPEMYPDLEEWIDNRAGGDSDDPLNPLRRVSGRICAGLGGVECVRSLEALGFEDVGVLELDWTHAATGIDAGTTTVIRYGDRGAVVPQFDPLALPDANDYPVAPMPSVLPAPLPANIPDPGTVVRIRVRTPLRVVVNPEDSPRRVLAPLPGEAYPDYVGRLQDRGLVGRVRTATDAETDPYAGPRAVVRVAPRPNARVRPATEVEVVANPDTTPDPTGPDPSAGGWVPPPVRAPDLGPLAGVRIGCDKFPFGVFCWMYQGLGGWGTNAQCPRFTVPIHNSGLLFDLCLFNPAMDVVRPIVGTVAAFGLAWMFAAAALGFGGGKGDES